MSDEKPFAEVDDYGYAIIEGMVCIFAETHSVNAAAAINAAVAAERRDAAAKALREAADTIPYQLNGHEPFRVDGLTTARSWLRSRADAIERGL